MWFFFQREYLEFSTAQPMVESTKEALGEIIVHLGHAEEEFFRGLMYKRCVRTFSHQ